jgi:glutaryl-CoA dehydrogenase
VRSSGGERFLVDAVDGRNAGGQMDTEGPSAAYQVEHEGMGTALGTDYLFIREDLDDAEVDYLERARRFVDDEVLPVIGGYWERAEVPWELVRRLGELRLVGDGIEGYGCPEMSPLAAGLINMEIHRGDGSLGTFLGVQAGLAMRAIAMYGSEEQKQRWLPPMARTEKLGAFALTEPTHGSDSVALATTARREGDEYVIDGTKRWIGNGTVADVTVVWARDDSDGQVKGFLVEKGTPGLEASQITGKVSVRAVWQADVALRGVRVPAENRLPGANTFKDTARVLASTRNICAYAALGHAVAAYDAALSYTKQRTQFGKPLVSFQIVQERLVRMLAEVTSMQLFCFRIARLNERGRLTDTIAGLAKMNNTRKARWVINEARDLLGGNGILLDYHVARHQVDIEAIHTFEGTETIQTLIVGRDITGTGAFH